MHSVTWRAPYGRRLALEKRVTLSRDEQRASAMRLMMRDMGRKLYVTICVSIEKEQDYTHLHKYL